MKDTIKKISNYILVGNGIATVIFGLFWSMGSYYLGALFACIVLASLAALLVLKAIEERKERKEDEDYVAGHETTSTIILKKDDYTEVSEKDAEAKVTSSEKKESQPKLNDDEKKAFDLKMSEYKKALVDEDAEAAEKVKECLESIVKTAKEREIKAAKAKKAAETKARKKAAEKEAEKLRKELLGE